MFQKRLLLASIGFMISSFETTVITVESRAAIIIIKIVEKRLLLIIKKLRYFNLQIRGIPPPIRKLRYATYVDHSILVTSCQVM